MIEVKDILKLFPEIKWNGHRFTIKLIGSPVLREMATSFDESFLKKHKKEIQELSCAMIETMNEKHGVGLAGPQIGLSKQIFVLMNSYPELQSDDTISKSYTEQNDKNDTTPLSEKNQLASKYLTFINPEIIEYSQETAPYDEGCLSVPNIHETVIRPISVKVKYLDVNLEEHIDTFYGLTARIIQHEYDHLEGHLYIDRLPLLRKQMILRKLK